MAKQRAIYQFIVEFTQSRGYPPSVREIGEAVGLRSPSTVHMYIKTLQEQGLIHKDDRKTRALTTSFTGGVPILGRVTAGSPIFASEEYSGSLAYRTDNPSDDFALRIKGDSMIGAGILDGDYVVVRRQETAENGAIVVALLGDEATCKRLSRKDGAVWLMPENPDYEPIDGSECALLGRVIAVVREL
jgi:repressor LexA